MRGFSIVGGGVSIHYKFRQRLLVTCWFLFLENDGMRTRERENGKSVKLILVFKVFFLIFEISSLKSVAKMISGRLEKEMIEGKEGMEREDDV